MMEVDTFIPCANLRHYMIQPAFESAVKIGGPASNGACLTLDGKATTLHEA